MSDNFSNEKVERQRNVFFIPALAGIKNSLVVLSLRNRTGSPAGL